MITQRSERIKILGLLGEQLRSEGVAEEIVLQAKNENPWFTPESIKRAIKELSTHYFDQAKIEEWLSSYPSKKIEPKSVGLILAGNIPLVGIHDIITVFLSGHKAQLKLSDKDKVLTLYILSLLKGIDARTTSHFGQVERLQDFDAVIATGSNSSGKLFQKYFSNVPNIIRTNRNGVAVIHKSSTEANLRKISEDIFSYFGLGCRNVSKLYIEEGVDKARVFEAIEHRREIINHHKYKNNYDYAYALYLLNKEDFFTNDFLIMRPHIEIVSRISVLHYEYFSDATKLAEELSAQADKIQCIVSDQPVGNLSVFPFGGSQSPGLSDYADGVDTMQFLLEL